MTASPFPSPTRMNIARRDTTCFLGFTFNKLQAHSDFKILTPVELPGLIPIHLALTGGASSRKKNKTREKPKKSFAEGQPNLC